MRRGDSRRGGRRFRGVVSRAESHGCMAAIGQLDDDIRVDAVADTNNG